MTSSLWNKRYKEGTPVRYFPTLGCKEFMDGITRSWAWDLCGTPVVLITGKIGGVALRNLVVIPGKGDYAGTK
ncbi:MAG: hypothetical protein NTX59_08410 [Elusimicrobia bacterium]|nr:hypothetical protein [Elusimicrobiota bacterium]